MLAIGSLAGALVLAGLAALIAIVTDAVTGQEALEKLFDGLATLAGALVVTGCVGVVIDGVNRNREARERTRDARLVLVRRLRSVHSQVKRAAILIDAHHTAHTYGEQMRVLIGARVEIGEVIFGIEQDAELPDQSRAAAVSALGEVAGYLDLLTAEYGDQYPRVSAIQQATHEWELHQARKLADQPSPPLPETIVGSRVPWTELTNSDAFPRLAILLGSLERDDDASAHVREFSKPLQDAGNYLKPS